VVPTGDRYVGAALSEDLRAWVPQLWRREVQGGHWLPLKQPELVADYVRQFVTAVAAGDDSGPLERARVHGVLSPPEA
jgi:hypothetical protein